VKIEVSRMNYRPEPIDTSGVRLPESIQSLTERLARNAHDVWAQRRLAEGWRFGEKRDDEKRRHPCLVPYDRLAAEEKEYDRSTAMETLRCILALGYRIVEPSEEESRE
jgi:hypothetical protein